MCIKCHFLETAADYNVLVLERIPLYPSGNVVVVYNRATISSKLYGAGSWSSDEGVDKLLIAVNNFSILSISRMWV
ncbi:hypothetical protein [Endozoicomonas sp. ONNA1]|uniref:hypothetical protein n=1 Tax=Endozoicomonas sp. ONNA1 TaxID=2828740 RepID=UPI0021480B76|nr:hypothetical protein [Endozoicomonas sp. ONNA1]